ncbi:MAG: hypothetical protein CMC36_00055 [Flavobacteriaceae bacterium]|nr:hypothetical protein [Flavobacteriaceae bacterium]|tara:strand:+ start:757 stop:1305 length:549 start_codon:yes stop_codon:yes gene_type:complete
MRHLLLLFILIFSQQFLLSQQFYTDKGVTKFDGSKAAFEPIKANNNNTVSIIDLSTGQIAAVILISDFDFRLGLMQEHFNENYLESNVYPKSTFEGQIKNFSLKELTQDFKEHEIKGVLTIKGVNNDIITKAKIRKIDEKIELSSGFSVMLSDYKVKIPKIVFKKIDEEVKINLNFVYERKQ